MWNALKGGPAEAPPAVPSLRAQLMFKMSNMSERELEELEATLNRVKKTPAKHRKQPERLHRGQIIGTKRYLLNLERGIKRGILTAPPQSGKTTSYRTIACEALRKGLISGFKIISAVPFNDLRAQIKDKNDIQDFLDGTYMWYLVEEKGLPERDARAFIEDADLARILHEEVYFGLKDLQKLADIPLRPGTLIIHDESHFAQKVPQQMGQLFSKLGIPYLSLDTNPINAFYMGVSATPYAQMSGKIHEAVDEGFEDLMDGIVRITPPSNYLGPVEMDRKGLIHKINQDEIIPTLQRLLPAMTDKYAVIRCEKKKLAGLEEVARQAGCAIDYYRQNSEFKLRDFEKRPERPTVVFVDNLLRLGNCLRSKIYIAFGMETSINPKVDSIVQGLLGRFSGIDAPEIHIYVSEKVSDQLDKAIKLSATGAAQCIPDGATGMQLFKTVKRKRSNEHEFHNIIPVELPWHDEYGNLKHGREVKAAKIESLRMDCWADRWRNFNGVKQSQEIQDIVYDLDTAFKFFDLQSDTAKSKGLYEKLVRNVQHRTVMEPGSTFGFHSEETDEVNVFVHAGVKRAFFICQTREESSVCIHDKIARSTGKDIFNVK